MNRIQTKLSTFLYAYRSYQQNYSNRIYLLYFDFIDYLLYDLLSPQNILYIKGYLIVFLLMLIMHFIIINVLFFYKQSIVESTVLVRI